MGLGAVVRSAVAVANDITADLQDTITIEQWTANATDGYPGKSYDSSISVSAIIEQGPRPFRTREGEVIQAAAVINILQPIAANGATGRVEPIDPRDRITLPDGYADTPIMGASGLVDPSTGRPYYYQIALGVKP